MKANAFASPARRTISIMLWTLALAAVALAAPPRPSQHAGSRRPASRPASRAASRPASRPTKPPSPIGIKQVTRDMLKQTVTVEGTVELDRSRLTRAQKRHIYQFTLSSDDALIDAVWWEDLAARLKPEQVPHEGDRIRVTGTVNEYRKALQIQPGWAEDITVLQRAATPGKPEGK